jgi:hypothetical protein
MTATTLCESTGIDILVWLSQWLNDNGGELRLVCTAQVLRVLTVTRTDQLFRIFDSLPEALATNRSYSPLHDHVSVLAFAQPPARHLGPDHSQITGCPWCHLTPSATWHQLESEYEQALRRHQTHKTMIAECDQNGTRVYTPGSAARFYCPVHERRVDKTAA